MGSVLNRQDLGKFLKAGNMCGISKVKHTWQIES